MSKTKKRSSPSDPKSVAFSPSKKRDFSSYYRHLIAVGLIAGVAFVVYSNTFAVPFLFDDRPNITLNPNVQIKVLTWDRIETLIKYTYRESIRVFAYFTFALNYYFGEFDLFGYHLVNLIVHVFSGIFLYGFLYLTLNLPSLREKYGPLSYKVALFASLIFIAHPIQTQSVTYIVQRMASMAGMFYLLTFVLYIRGRLSKGKARCFWFGGGIVTYLLGVFSKENVAILPFFIVLYEFYFFQDFDLSPKGKKVLSVLIGALLVLGAFGLLLWGRRYIQVTIDGYQMRSFTMGERVLTQFRIVLYYLSLLIYPHPSRLNLDYDFPVSKSILDPASTLISMVVVLGLIGYSLWTAKKRPVLSFCILWYFGNLVIESSIFPLEMVFEHRLYLPSIGPFILFALLAVKGIEKGKERWTKKRVLEWEKG
jgi:protein O-mannosyl-transferase